MPVTWKTAEPGKQKSEAAQAEIIDPAVPELPPSPSSPPSRLKFRCSHEPSGNFDKAKDEIFGLDGGDEGDQRMRR
jgi:hypothetical protein